MEVTEVVMKVKVREEVVVVFVVVVAVIVVIVADLVKAKIVMVEI